MPYGAPLTVQVTGQTPMSCDEVHSVSEQYVGLITNMSKDDVLKYGNSGIRQFDGWSCSVPSAGVAESMGYTYHCSNEAEGKEFVSPLE